MLGSVGCSRCPVPHICISARRHRRLNMRMCRKAPGRIQGVDYYKRSVRSRCSQKEAWRQRRSTKCIFLSLFFLASCHSLKITPKRIKWSPSIDLIAPDQPHIIDNVIDPRSAIGNALVHCAAIAKLIPVLVLLLRQPVVQTD
jgi:hypothetical protein